MSSLPSPTPIGLTNYKQYLLPRARDANKGNFGHVLIIGGCPGMSGAVLLAAQAAMRVGAGRVSIATHPLHAHTLNINFPELMSHGIQSLDDLKPLLEKATTIAIGPGLGRDIWGKSILEYTLEIRDRPIIIDADALFHLPHLPYITQPYHVLTPHPGEAAYLLNTEATTIQNDRRAALSQIVKNYPCVCVLKGMHTLIGDSQQSYVCYAGNPGMASAGMGDILTGVIAGLCAQHIPTIDAASLAVLIHAMAGDLAAQEGERGMIASDLLSFLHKLINPINHN